MERRSIYLYGQHEKGFSINITAVIQGNGTFKNKGNIRCVDVNSGSKHAIRDKDRRYFKYHGVNIKGMEVHHDWENGGTAFLLTPEEHKQKEARDY